MHNSEKAKPPVHITYEQDGYYFIRRDKEPTFFAEYDPNTLQITNVQWSESEPGQAKQIELLKKAGAFLKHGNR